MSNVQRNNAEDDGNAVIILDNIIKNYNIASSENMPLTVIIDFYGNNLYKTDPEQYLKESK